MKAFQGYFIVREHQRKNFEFLNICLLGRRVGEKLTDKLRQTLDENLSFVKYGLYMNKLQIYQTGQNNVVKNHLKCLLRNTYS